VTRFAQPCVHTDALSVLLSSALYLYLLPGVLIGEEHARLELVLPCFVLSQLNNLLQFNVI
jgi:hypothetical protein